MPDCTITVVGNLTRDIELRYTTGGRAVGNAGLAVAHRFQQNGEWTETTSFINMVMWGELAEHAVASLPKGTRVIASGRLEIRPWETKEGEKRNSAEIIVDAIGPDLKWATASVERIQRTTPGEAVTRPATGSSGPVHDPVYATQEEPF